MTIARSSASISATTFLACSLAFASRVGRDVGRRHARGTIDQEHESLSLPGSSPHPRAGERQHHKRDRQKLKKEQQIAPQPLKQAIDVQVLKASPPEDRTGNANRPPPQLEKIKRNDSDRHAGQGKPERDSTATS